MIPCMYIEVVTTTSDASSKVLRTLFLVTLYLYSRDVCCTSLLVETEAAPTAQGKNAPGRFRRPSAMPYRVHRTVLLCNTNVLEEEPISPVLRDGVHHLPNISVTVELHLEHES